MAQGTKDATANDAAQLMLDSVKDEVILLDKDGRIQTWNRGAAALKGYAAEEVIGKPVTIFYTEDDVKTGLAERELKQAENQGRYDTEGWRVKKGGEKFWAAVTLAPVRDADGSLKGYVKVARDLSERRNKEQAARISDAMINSLSDAEVIFLDKEGVVQTWNRGAEALKGYSASEVIGKPVTIFYTEEDAKGGLAQRELAVAEREGKFQTEGWRVKKGGDRFWAEVILNPIRDEEGRLTGYVKVARDLTERMERERMVQRQRDEIMALSTPVIRIWDKVLALPIIGTLDSQRAQRLTEHLLERISADEAVVVIMDISGVPVIDSAVAQHMLKTIQAARLMGATTILSGVRPETAQAMVHLGIEMGQVKSRSSLRDALQLALQVTGAVVGATTAGENGASVATAAPDSHRL